MKTRILLTVIALASSAVATTAFASGDVSADRYWTRQAQQASPRSSAGTAHEHGAPVSMSSDTRKADEGKCACAMMSGSHASMMH